MRGYGAVWRITNIDGDFSIAFENTDKTDIRSVQSIIGHWKENFVKQGYEYVSPDEIRQTADITTKPVVEDDNDEEFEEIHDEPANDYFYGEQLSLFGEPMHEVETPEKTIIDGIDIEEALKRELIQHGTGFVDGKFRVEQFYLEHKGDTKELAAFLSKEFGVGDHSGEGKILGVDCNMFGVRGIVMRVALDNGEETRVSWNWNKVANRIATLIDKQEYITQHDIDERISRAKHEMAHNSADSKEYRKAVDILDSYGLLPEKEGARQEQTNEIKAGDSFMYHGNVVTVTDDKGIYPDDIVIKREDKVGDVAFAVTENVNIERFAREAKRILLEKEIQQTAEISNPLVKELAKTFPADTAERLYNAFEGAKMADWQSNQAKINRVKRALYDILGNEVQTESAFSVLSSGEAPKLKDVVIDLSPNTVDYDREGTPEQSQDKASKTANDKINYTLTTAQTIRRSAKMMITTRCAL